MSMVKRLGKKLREHCAEEENWVIMKMATLERDLNNVLSDYTYQIDIPDSLRFVPVILFLRPLLEKEGFTDIRFERHPYHHEFGGSCRIYWGTV